jgi:hypothetical protein
VNVQGAGAIAIVGPPDAPEELIPRDGLPGLRDQHGQNATGDRPELMDSPVDLEVP